MRRAVRTARLERPLSRFVALLGTQLARRLAGLDEIEGDPMHLRKLAADGVPMPLPQQQKLVDEIGSLSAELWAAIQKGKREYAVRGGK